MKSFLLGAAIALLVLDLMGAFSGGSDSHLLPNLPKLGQGKTLANPVNNPIIRIMAGVACTAFVIDPNYAITAGHCLDNDGKLRKESFTVYNDKGENTGVKAQPVGISYRNDSGLLKGNFENFKPIKVELEHFGFVSNPPFFVACGYPMGQKELICNPFFPKTNASFAIVGSGYLVPGMSGGPVINPENDEAVAINSYVTDGGVGVMPLQGLKGAFNLE